MCPGEMGVCTGEMGVCTGEIGKICTGEAECAHVRWGTYGQGSYI